jgi:hypothetical protein
MDSDKYDLRFLVIFLVLLGALYYLGKSPDWYERIHDINKSSDKIIGDISRQNHEGLWLRRRH